MTTVFLAHTNVEAPDPVAQNHNTILRALASGDVVTLNEAREKTSQDVVRSAAGFSAHIAGENVIAWRVDRFAEKAVGRRVVMRGGHVGAGFRRTDHRRVGPSREVAWALLEDVFDADVRLIVATHHAVARADTKYKWRRRIRARGFAAVAKELRHALAHHDAPLVLTGDMNTVGRIVFRIHGLREVKTPATYGGKRYDRIFVLGCKARRVKTFRTNSDHLGLTAEIDL